ncbi:MAG: hypothetical protein NE330_05580 [Lentisphaeraceae bacterium]|nr:hypothetical protein [Lentisphaeraceae bacterium]
MRAFLVTSLFFIFSASSQEHFYTEKINILEAEKIKVSVNYFEVLRTKAIVSRNQFSEFVEGLKKVNGRALTGLEIETLQKHLLDQIYLRESFYKLVQTYRYYPKYISGQTTLSFPNRLKGGMLALSASCLLIDNYLLCLKKLQEEDSLRRLMNKGDGGVRIEAEQLQAVVDSFNSRENRRAFRQALEWFENSSERVKDLSKSDRQMKSLSLQINESPATKVVGRGNLFVDYLRKAKGSTKIVTDSFVSIGSKSSNSASRIFGNSIGAVQFRNGLLYGDKKVAESMKLQLKPLDILLEKTPFRLTDKFIPGHFGHVAIWIGTEAQLKEAGLWNTPFIKPYQKQITAGYCVLEALRDGVQLNTLDHFLDVDDVAVLRCKDHDHKASLEKAMRQVGKEYDFNFDVETSDKIVCSELVYHVFPEINWPTSKTMGRYTISPDNVAVKAVDGLFEMKYFMHDGKDADFETYKALLGR